MRRGVRSKADAVRQVRALLYRAGRGGYSGCNATEPEPETVHLDDGYVSRAQAGEYRGCADGVFKDRMYYDSEGFRGGGYGDG